MNAMPLLRSIPMFAGLNDEDLAALSAGDVYGLYQHGKLRVDGDVSVAHRLGLLKGLL